MGGAFICGIGTATPAARYTKAECLTAFEKSDWFNRLDGRSHIVARTVLQRDNGIDARRLAVASLDEVFQIDPDTLAQRFLTHAPALATAAAAALPNLQLDRTLLTSGDCRHVLSVCVEVSSAAMYLDNDPGVLICACLFGDGAGAAVLSRSAPGPGCASRVIEWLDSSSLIVPEQRDALKFESRQGMLRNVLTRAVPAPAADHALLVLQTVLQRAGLSRGDVSAWIMHAGGRDVLKAVERRFELNSTDLRYSAAMLREYGNLSSAFVYFVLQAALADNAQGGWWWLSAFGAGFSCHGALLRVQ